MSFEAGIVLIILGISTAIAIIFNLISSTKED
jgi:hypothetical protein